MSKPTSKPIRSSFVAFEDPAELQKFLNEATSITKRTSPAVEKVSALLQRRRERRGY